MLRSVELKMQGMANTTYRDLMYRTTIAHV